METKYASINEFQSIALADEISHDRNDKSSSLDQSILIEKSSHLSHHMKEKDHSQKQSVFDDISFSNFDSDQYQTDSLLPSSIQDEDFKIIHDNTEPRSLELCEMNVMGSKEESTESLSTYENMRIINCINDAESIIILDPECTKISSSLAFEKFAIDSIDIQIKPKKVEMMADLRVEKNFLKYSNLGFDDDKRNEHVKDDSQLYMHETVDLNDVSDPHMAQNSVNKSDAKSESLESTISFQSSEFKEENSSDYLHLSEEITNEISRNLKIGRIPDLYLKSEAITKKRFKEGPVIEIESSDMSHSLAHTSSNQERALTNNAHVFFPSIDSEFEESFERISLCLSDIPFQEDIIDTSNIQSISSKDADAKSENESIPSNNSGFQVVEKADSDNSIEVKNDHDEHVSNVSHFLTFYR